MEKEGEANVKKTDDALVDSVILQGALEVEHHEIGAYENLLVQADARRGGRPLPERVGAADLLTIGVASHKLSRVIAKDKVTSPLRAPFTTLEGEGG